MEITIEEDGQEINIIQPNRRGGHKEDCERLGRSLLSTEALW